MKLLVIALIAAVIYLLEKYTVEHCFDSLSYAMKCDRTCAECGEMLTFTTEIINDKLLPLLYLEVREYMPAEADSPQFSDSGYRALGKHSVRTIYIMPHQKVSFSSEVSFSERGRYVIPNARLTGGDLLGLNKAVQTVNSGCECVIYPRPLDLDIYEPAFGSYIGSVSVKRFIMPDPIQTAGFREYTGHEALKDISWVQSLKRNSLMVRQYDYTSDQKAFVLTDIDGTSAEEAEKCFSAARTVIDYLEKHHIVYSFACNAAMNPMSTPAYIHDGCGRRHYESVLEALGRAACRRTMSTDRLLSSVFPRNAEIRSWFLITAGQDRLKARMASLQNMTGTGIFVIDVREVNV